MNRRQLLVALGLSAALPAVPGLLSHPARAAPSDRFRIGFQKNGVLVVARNQKLIEKALEPDGIAVEWIEFQAGPPLLEAMNVGSIDFGTTGDAPPIFAQAANANILYAAALPSRGRNSAILVPAGSAIATLADLKGKRLAFTRGSSAHNVAVVALEKAGLSFSDVEPVFLSPADAGAAFASGSIDAWSIWDPFYASAELNQGARVLARGDELLGATNSFFLANADFAASRPAVLRAAIAGLGEAGRWAEANRDGLAAAMSEATGVPVAIQRQTAERGEYMVTPVTPEIVAQQQAVADRFAALKLIPARVDVASRLWRDRQS